jgi:hypothetical protein
MKNYRRIGKFAPILFIASLSMFVCDMTRAEDSIKRKSGLWESKFTMMGMTNSA